MFEKTALIRLAESVLLKEEERSHFEETGVPMVHFDFEILNVGPALFSSGRSGNYYKFTFEYELTFLDEAHLKESTDEVRTFRRSLRLDETGNVVGIGERVPLSD